MTPANNNRRFIIKLAGLVILLLIAIAVLILSLTSNHQAKPKTVANQPQPKIVPIKNIGSYSKINPKFTTSLEQSLYLQLKQSVKSIPKSYYGVVRSGSVTTSHTTEIVGFTSDKKVDVQIVSFLVDIPAAQRTYEAKTYSGGDGQVSQSYVLCPTKKENKYGDFTCVNQP